ncbi:MAG TPA: prepilin-type N-terminal cleavage/methylation domain-containing protein [Stellaceae bacterium]|nr:prepilin-type N-terminal cleavage/methylation domain-containing protein [Stellaceae bacterium]
MPRLAESGFTLLEVLVALAIAGLALAGLFAAGGTGLFAADTAARAEEALERAQSHLAALGRDGALHAGDSAGEDGGGYRWQLHVHPVASRRVAPANGVFGSAGTTTLYEVEVVISWRAGGHTRRVALRSLRLAGATGME